MFPESPEQKALEAQKEMIVKGRTVVVLEGRLREEKMTQYETTEAQENGICGKENGGGRDIDGFWLKMLAVVTMLIDHIGAIFFPGVLWIRAIGRLSFPIYAFLLTEGFHHTRSTDSYLKRLVLFACISEPFFDLAFYGELIHPCSPEYLFHAGSVPVHAG